MTTRSSYRSRSRPWKIYALMFAGAFFFGGFINFLLLLDFAVFNSVSLFMGVFITSLTTWVMMDTIKDALTDY